MNKISEWRKVLKKRGVSFKDFKEFDKIFWLAQISFCLNHAINYTFLSNVYEQLNPL